MSFRPVIFNEADVVGGVYKSTSGGTTIKSGMFVVLRAPSTQYGATYGKIYVGPILPAAGVSSSTLYAPGMPAAAATTDGRKWAEAILNRDKISLIFKDNPDPESTMYSDATISHNDDILIFRGKEFSLHKNYFGAASAFNNASVGTYLYLGTSGKLILHSAKSTKVMARVAPVAMVIATANNYASCIYLK